MAMLLDARNFVTEGECCPMPRCKSLRISDVCGGGKICFECNVWFDQSNRIRNDAPIGPRRPASAHSNGQSPKDDESASGSRTVLLERTLMMLKNMRFSRTVVPQTLGPSSIQEPETIPMPSMEMETNKTLDQTEHQWSINRWSEERNNVPMSERFLEFTGQASYFALYPYLASSSVYAHDALQRCEELFGPETWSSLSEIGGAKDSTLELSDDPNSEIPSLAVDSGEESSSDSQ
ncbi:hypothetical protein B9Z65_7498 [Elsinoe australis]|uniref:Uncharacterized protein n=1 Tax=Elsinoe australis TaxID=40998 RepID=A0A2P7YCB6_9PEZI|nr:hypothetical protein B9Z65_7498 [Elsinoe australis]